MQYTYLAGKYKNCSHFYLRDLVIHGIKDVFFNVRPIQKAYEARYTKC